MNRTKKTGQDDKINRMWIESHHILFIPLSRPFLPGPFPRKKDSPGAAKPQPKEETAKDAKSAVFVPFVVKTSVPAPICLYGEKHRRLPRFCEIAVQRGRRLFPDAVRVVPS
jgi:hypothetical protein